MKQGISSLKKKLDTAFSQYIRLRAVDDNGMGRCFTCQEVFHYKEVDCGHFMTRAAGSTRYHELNCQFQCKRCNIYNSGHQFKFGNQLNEKYGEGTAEEIEILSKRTHRFSHGELVGKIQHYKNEVAKLKREKGL